MTDNKINKEKILKITLISYFSVFIILISFSQLAGEDDLFWYLSTGRYIIQNSTVPSADVFGFTTSGTDWIPLEWAWDVINYFVFTSGGFSALSFLSVSIIVILFYLLFRLFTKFSISYHVSVIFLLLLSFGMMMRLSLKPHLVSYIFFLLVLTIIINYRYFERTNYKKLWLLPLIFFVWVNMHMGVLAGIFLMSLFVLAEITGSALGKKKTTAIKPLNSKELLRLILILVISVMVTLVNPHGLKTYQFAFELVSLKQLDVIYEWASPFSSAYLFQFSNFIYYLFILGLIPVIYYSFKQKDILPALLCIGFFVQSTRSYRFTVDFMIISVLFIALALKYLASFKAGSKIRPSFIQNSAFKVLFSILLLILILSVPNNSLYSFLGYPRKFGSGIDEKNFPVNMYKFMKDNDIANLGSRPFNTYETGGFFIWNFPGKKNFIGGRTIFHKVWNDYTSIINLQPGFENKIDSIDFDYFIWMIPLVNYSQTPALLDYGILSYLFRNQGKWKLIYWDDNSFLFVRNVPNFAELIAKFEYNYFTPFNFYFRKDLIDKCLTEDINDVLTEFNRKQAEDPKGVFFTTMKKYYGDKLK